MYERVKRYNWQRPLFAGPLIISIPIDEIIRRAIRGDAELPFRCYVYSQLSGTVSPVTNRLLRREPDHDISRTSYTHRSSYL